MSDYFHFSDLKKPSDMSVLPSEFLSAWVQTKIYSSHFRRALGGHYVSVERNSSGKMLKEEDEDEKVYFY